MNLQPDADDGHAMARRLAEVADDVARTLDEVAATRDDVAATRDEMPGASRAGDDGNKRPDAQRARDFAEAERNESRRLRAEWDLPARE